MILPQGWVATSIGECSESIQYGLTCTSTPNGTGFRYVRITDIQNRQIEWDSVPFADAAGQKAGLYQIAVNDILFARTGATVGKSYLIRQLDVPAVFASYLIRVRCRNEALLPEFAAWYFQSPRYWEQIVEGAEGTGQPNFNGTKLANLGLSLPPLAEQRRIVAKLDALTARLARARAELDRVYEMAGTLRIAAVRTAFAGELTADWRGSSGEGADKPYRKDLPHGAGLPRTWVLKTLGEIAEIKSGVTLGKKYPSGVELLERPYLRVANVQRGALDLSVIKYVSVTAREADALYLRAGDILMNEGGDRDKLGRGWIWSGEIENCIHQNHVFRIRLRNNGYSPKYVSYYANEFGQGYFVEHGTQTTNLASISKTKMSSLPVPLAPAAEQIEIVRRLDSVFARADRLKAEATRAQSLLDRLESALLAKAFRGELTPQDLNDEPASALLDRIRATRTAQPKPKRGRTPQAPSTTRAPRKKAAMTKSRSDDAVKDKPYLAGLLRAAGGKANAETLFKDAELPIADFYKQLAWEVDAGHIKDNAQVLEAT